MRMNGKVGRYWGSAWEDPRYLQRDRAWHIGIAPRPGLVACYIGFRVLREA